MERGLIVGLLVCLALAGVAVGEGDSGHVEPKNVNASCASASATVSWSAVNDDHLVGYDVYQEAAGESTYTQVNPALVTGTQYTVTGLQSGTSYSFGVVAVYGDGHRSAMGGPASCTTT